MEFLIYVLWELRNVMGFMNNEEELLLTLEKDSVEDAHNEASEDTPLLNISVTPNLSELEVFVVLLFLPVNLDM